MIGGITMTEEKQDTITMVLDMGDDSVEVELTREEYDNIVWSAGRANMNIEDFINEVLKKEINKMRKEDEEEGV